VLCRFHVGTGVPGVAPHYIPAPTTFVASRFPTGSIKPWFLTEGKLAAVLIIPSSWGSQLTCDFTRIKHIFWRRCRGFLVAAARGVSHTQSLYFVYCLALFYFLSCLLYIKNTKKLVTCLLYLFRFLYIKNTKKLVTCFILFNSVLPCLFLLLLK